MWHADDDEISPNLVNSLVTLLNRNDDAVSAAGNWQLLVEPGRSIDTSFPTFESVSTALRVWNYIWRSSDVFFYGLHRTSNLRAATIKRYWWPNRGELLDWAYVYLIDLVIDGKILRSNDPNARLITHSYVQKEWRVPSRLIATILRGLVRRVNVQVLMLEKVYRRCGVYVWATAVPISILVLLREILGNAFEHTRRLLLNVTTLQRPN
jgi:hypothetical protein